MGNSSETFMWRRATVLWPKPHLWKQKPVLWVGVRVGMICVPVLLWTLWCRSWGVDQMYCRCLFHILLLFCPSSPWIATGSLTSLELTKQARLSGWKTQGLCSLYLPNPWILSEYPMTSQLTFFLKHGSGIKFTPTCLGGRHVTVWTIRTHWFLQLCFQELEGADQCCPTPPPRSCSSSSLSWGTCKLCCFLLSVQIETRAIPLVRWQSVLPLRFSISSSYWHAKSPHRAKLWEFLFYLKASISIGDIILPIELH